MTWSTYFSSPDTLRSRKSSKKSLRYSEEHKVTRLSLLYWVKRCGTYFPSLQTFPRAFTCLQAFFLNIRHLCYLFLVNGRIRLNLFLYLSHRNRDLPPRLLTIFETKISLFEPVEPTLTIYNKSHVFTVNFTYKLSLLSFNLLIKIHEENYRSQILLFYLNFTPMRINRLHYFLQIKTFSRL